MKAEADHKSSVIAFALGLVGLIIGATVLGIAGIAFLIDFGFLALVMFIGSLIFAGAGGFGLVTSKKAKSRADESMREAFGAVALDVMRQRGPITAPALAEVLGVPVEIADAALTRLPARTDVRVDTVLDERAADGQVRYRVSDQTMPAEVLSEHEAASADFDARLKASIAAKDLK